MRKLPSQRSSASEEEKQAPQNQARPAIQTKVETPVPQPIKPVQPVVKAAETIDLLDL